MFIMGVMLKQSLVNVLIKEGVDLLNISGKKTCQISDKLL